MTKLYDLSRLRMMIIDDNRHQQTLMRAILRGFNIEAVEAYKAATEAYNSIIDFGPDIAFIDLEMPNLNGVEFTKLLRRDPHSPNAFLPIIIVSAYGDRKHVVDARDSGANEFLVKPISVQSVYARITAIIEQPRPFVRSAEYVGPCRRRHRDTNYKGPERRATAGKRLTQYQVDEILQPHRS